MTTNSTPEQTLQQLRGAIKEAATAAAQTCAPQYRTHAFLGALAGQLDRLFCAGEGDALFELVLEQRA